MGKLILMTGAAIALGTAPAVAGGPLANNLLGGLTGAATNQGTSDRATGSLGNCLCNTANSLTSRARSTGTGAARAATLRGSALANTVVGLNAVGRAGNGHGTGQAIGLAGTVSGTAGSVTSLTAGHGTGRAFGLAGTVAGTANAALAGHAGRGGIALAGAAGTATNAVAALGRGHGKPLALAGTANAAANAAASVTRRDAHAGGSVNGRSLVNVSVLNRTGTSGRSAVNVAALNGTAGGNGQLVNVAVLNGRGSHGGGHGGGGNGGLGLPNGVQLINGVLCGPDGTPLTPAAAAVMAMIGGKHGGSSAQGGSSSAPSGSSAKPGGSSQAPRATPRQSQSASRTPTSTKSTPIAYGERHSQVSH